MAFEKRLAVLAPRLLTSDGSVAGQLQIDDAFLLKVKQKLVLRSNTQPPLNIQVQRVTSPTTFFVSKVNPDSGIDERIDVSAYLTADSASVSSPDAFQPRPNIAPEDWSRAVYDEEPTVAIRTIGVDRLGTPWSETNPYPTLTSFLRDGAPQQVSEDTSNPANNKPLPVKLTGVQGDVIIDAENLNLLVQTDGEYNPSTNPDPDSTAIILHQRGTSQDKTKQLVRPTAVRGSVDTDAVAIDVALRDYKGDKFTEFTPLPISSNYEKILEVIGRSKWLDSAVYDRVVLSGNPERTVINAGFYEDGALIGDAVINFGSDLSWDFNLYRYLVDDDSSKLLDDDDSPLLLE